MENSGKRLNKYISDAGVASRREADRLIAAGRVEIRRKTRKDEPEAEAVRAKLGDLVYHGDTVYVNGRELPKKEAARVYYLYNKPAGVICTSDPDVDNNVIKAAGIPKKVSYAGRLDKDSRGLLILTNDGDLIDRLMRASSYHEKEYICTVSEPVHDEFLDSLRKGVKIHLDDEETLRKNPKGIWVTTRPCRVRKTGERSFAITLTQGYNRQIRRMCKALGNPVTSLTRIRICSLRLGDLKSGELRKMTPEEVKKLIEETNKVKEQRWKKP